MPFGIYLVATAPSCSAEKRWVVVRWAREVLPLSSLFDNVANSEILSSSRPSSNPSKVRPHVPSVFCLATARGPSQSKSYHYEVFAVAETLNLKRKFEYYDLPELQDPFDNQTIELQGEIRENHTWKHQRTRYLVEDTPTYLQRTALGDKTPRIVMKAYTGTIRRYFPSVARHFVNRNDKCE